MKMKFTNEDFEDEKKKSFVFSNDEIEKLKKEAKKMSMEETDKKLNSAWQELMARLFDTYHITEIVFDERLSKNMKEMQKAKFGMDIMIGMAMGNKERNNLNL